MMIQIFGSTEHSEVYSQRTETLRLSGRLACRADDKNTDVSVSSGWLTGLEQKNRLEEMLGQVSSAVILASNVFKLVFMKRQKHRESAQG